MRSTRVRRLLIPLAIIDWLCGHAGPRLARRDVVGHQRVRGDLGVVADLDAGQDDGVPPGETWAGVPAEPVNNNQRNEEASDPS
jgi:hypothetical protein